MIDNEIKKVLTNVAKSVDNQIDETKESEISTDNSETKIELKESMSIPDMIKAYTPEIKKALPSVISLDRFTRIALSALNNNPKLNQCTPISFLTALMNAAQLGLEPNTPLGQAYLIPYKNRGNYECQFQLGYKGLIDLAYRSGEIQTVQAHSVYENDLFEYQYGLESKLVHKPEDGDRGQLMSFYAVWKNKTGGYGFAVMTKNDMDLYAKKYSKSFDSNSSPWKSNYEEMAKKTVIKQALKYAPIKTDFQRALSTDETIKTELNEDMYVVENELIDNEK